MKDLLRCLIFTTMFMIFGLIFAIFTPAPTLSQPYPSFTLTFTYFHSSHVMNVPAYLEYSALHEIVTSTFPEIDNETYFLAHPNHRKRLNERRWIDVLKSNPSNIEIFIIANVFSFSRSNTNLSLLPYTHSTCRNFNLLKPKAVYFHIHDEREKGNFTYESDLPGATLLKVKIAISSSLLRNTLFWFGNEAFCEQMRGFNIHVPNIHCTLLPVKLHRPYSDAKIRWVVPNWEVGGTYAVDIITATNAIATDDILVCQNYIAMGGRCSFKERIHTQIDRLRLKRVVATYDEVFSISEFFGYWHLIGESLPRLALFYDYLQNNTNIKIAVSSGNLSYRNWVRFLGFNWDERIVVKNDGPFRARKYMTVHMTPCEIPRRYEFLALSNIVRSRLKINRIKLCSIIFSFIEVKRKSIFYC